jgi:hypothetical protein
MKTQKMMALAAIPLVATLALTPTEARRGVFLQQAELAHIGYLCGLGGSPPRTDDVAIRAGGRDRACVWALWPRLRTAQSC